ncbi:hypothetical protein H4R33_006764 [Dimargaris cristalligena]|nr:hypothetical protein H4R33_006764 [Dimargaris cristalligena]
MSDPHQSPPECQLNTVPGLLGSVLHYNTTCQGTYGGKTNRTDTRPTRFLPSLILSPIDCWCICFWIFWTLITRRCRYPVLYNIKFADGTRYISRLRITVHASRTPQVVCVTTFLRLPHASPDASTSIASTETPGPESYYTSDVGLITFQDPRVHAFSKMQRKTVALDTWADSITLSIPGCYTNPHNTYQQVTLVGIDFLGPDESFASLTSTLAPDPVWETKESPAGTMIAPHPWSDFPASPQAGGDLIAGGFPKTVTHSDLEPPSTSPPPASPQLSNATRLAYEDPDGVSFAMSSLPTWRSFAHSPTPSHASIDDILAGLEPEERPRSPPQVKQKKMATPVVNPPHPLKIPDSVSITIPSSVIRAANSSTNPSDQLARPLSFGAKVEAAQTLLEAVEHHCNSNPQSRHNRFRFADIGLSPDFNDTEFLDKLMTLLAAHFFPDRRARLSRITLSILYNLVNYTLVSEARMLDLVMVWVGYVSLLLRHLPHYACASTADNSPAKHPKSHLNPSEPSNSLDGAAILSRLASTYLQVDSPVILQEVLKTILDQPPAPHKIATLYLSLVRRTLLPWLTDRPDAQRHPLRQRRRRSVLKLLISESGDRPLLRFFRYLLGHPHTVVRNRSVDLVVQCSNWIPWEILQEYLVHINPIIVRTLFRQYVQSVQGQWSSPLSMSPLLSLSLPLSPDKTIIGHSRDQSQSSSVDTRHVNWAPPKHYDSPGATYTTGITPATPCRVSAQTPPLISTQIVQD